MKGEKVDLTLGEVSLGEEMLCEQLRTAQGLGLTNQATRLERAVRCLRLKSLPNVSEIPAPAYRRNYGIWATVVFRSAKAAAEALADREHFRPDRWGSAIPDWIPLTKMVKQLGKLVAVRKRWRRWSYYEAQPVDQWDGRLPLHGLSQCQRAQGLVDALEVWTPIPWRHFNALQQGIELVSSPPRDPYLIGVIGDRFFVLAWWDEVRDTP